MKEYKLWDFGYKNFTKGLYKREKSVYNDLDGHLSPYNESNEQEKSTQKNLAQRAVVPAESDRAGGCGVRLLAADAKRNW